MNELLHHFFNFAILADYWPVIWQGLLTTVSMSVWSIVIGIPAGFCLMLARLFGNRAVIIPLVAIVDILRAIPPLMLIVLVYFGLPYFGLNVSSFWTTVLCVAAVLAAFSEEIFWASVTAIPAGQWEAGICSGLTRNQVVFSIIVPQSIPMSIPSLTNRAIAAGKSTTLGSVVAVSDLLSVTSSIQSKLANPTALTVGAMLFVVIFIPFVLLTRWLERRYGGKRVW